jgi:beta-lactamase regulating signal transducer with metallopeptidase domain
MDQLIDSLIGFIVVVVPVLLLCVLKLAILLGLVYLICLTLRRLSAAAKHLFWLVGLTAGLALPFLFATKGWEILIPPAPVSISELAPTTVGTSQSRIDQGKSSHAVSMVGIQPPSAVHGAGISSIGSAWTGRQLGVFLVAIWLLGVALLWFKLLVGNLIAHRRVRREVKPVGPVWSDLCAALSRELTLTSVVTVRLGANCTMPVVCGLWRSTILLPAEANDWSVERRRIVLLHELAHIKRRDCLTQFLAAVICALYWFNPMVWVAARQMRHLREQACDDLVLRHGTRPSDYAGHLLEVARSFREPGTRLCLSRSATVAMARRSSVETRVVAILAARPNLRRSDRALKISIAIVFSGILLPLFVIQPKRRSLALADLSQEANYREPEPSSENSPGVFGVGPANLNQPTYRVEFRGTRARSKDDNPRARARGEANSPLAKPTGLHPLGRLRGDLGSLTRLNRLE